MRRWTYIVGATPFSWPTGLVHHFAADEITGKANGDSVTAWTGTPNTLSITTGSDNFAYQSGAKSVAPIYHTGGAGSKPYLTMDHSRMQRGQVNSTFGTTANTWFLVIKAKKVASGAMYLMDSANNENGTQSRYSLFTANVINFETRNDPATGTGASQLYTFGFSDNTVTLFTCIHNGSASGIRVNGVAQNVNGGGTTATVNATKKWPDGGSRISIGCLYGSDGGAPESPTTVPYDLRTDFYESALFNRAMTSGELASIEAYLMTKYGL